jgi:hypothetical protein
VRSIATSPPRSAFGPATTLLARAIPPPLQRLLVVGFAVALALLARGATPAAFAESAAPDSIASPDSTHALEEPVTQPDSSVVRFELGASTDLSNEIFYTDDVDTTFLRPRLVGSPEGQVSGVSRILWRGSRGAGAWGYRLQNDASVGGLIQSEVLEWNMRNARTEPRRLELTSRLGYRHDQSFDRDLIEWRADGSGRGSVAFGDGMRGELGGRWDFGRSRGSSAAFLPNRNAGGGWVAIENGALSGMDWRLGYGLTGRAYPDSIIRDHLEHSWEGRLRYELPGLSSLEIESSGERRTTIHSAPNSRDQFVNGEASAELRWRPVERLETRTRFEGEWITYDQPDSILYFDYHVLRSSITFRLENASPFSISLGPHLQWLRSPADETEAYDEAAGALELEWLGIGSWWNLAPLAGWREYRLEPSGHPFEDVGLHSSYAFIELSAFAEQGLGPLWHLRFSGTARDERHRDATQNARSLYFSLDIRRLF